MSTVYLGEVISSSLTSWTVQAWEWEQFPEFGSIVRLVAGDHLLFGQVYDIQTGSDDPTRQPFAYQKTALELRRDQPQIFEFLKTRFICLPIGYQHLGVLQFCLPPKPPQIHTFVAPATAQDLAVLCKSGGLLQVLFTQATKVEAFEELLLALLRYLKPHGLVTREFLMQMMEHLTLLWASDYRRLKLFMDRVGSTQTDLS